MVPVMELLGTGLATEVPSHTAQLPSHGLFTQLTAMVTADTLQT